MNEKDVPIGVDAICGFSLSFCVALLKKLRELIRTKKVLMLSDTSTSRPSRKGGGRETVYKLTPIARAIVDSLNSQLRLSEYDSDDHFTEADIEEYMAVAREFLDIFKPKL